MLPQVKAGDAASGICGGDGACRQDGSHEVYRSGCEFFRRRPVRIMYPLLCSTVDGPTCRGGDQFRIDAAFHWMLLEAVHQDDANLVDYCALDKGFELALFEGAGFMQFGEIVTDGENDRVKCSGTGTVKTDFPAFEELKEADADELFE